MYDKFIKYFLFLLPPEVSHAIGMAGVKCIGFLHRMGIWKRGSWSDNKRLNRETPFGLLPNPLGLAAGFDKNAEGLWGWQGLGFGFVEVGTVTPLPQPGNHKPRLYRYVRHRALVNRMGFNNEGVKVVAARIRKARSQGLKIKIGGNIGKNLETSLEGAPTDYGITAKELSDCVDYLVINVSSPNTPKLRDLQSEKYLDLVVASVREVAPQLPLFVKLGPDNFESFKEGLINVAKKYSIAGVICGNTLANHASAVSMEAGDIARLPNGGLSGKPIFENNLHLCEAYSVSAPDLLVIGVGGIEDHFQAIRYFQAHAKLIQVYTGFIFGGPSFVKKMLKALVQTSIDRENSRKETL